MMKRGKIIIEPTCIAVTLSADGTVWMTIEEIATIFQVTTASVERRIIKMLDERELDEREARTEEVKICGSRRCIVEYYNLDMVIALSYRIDTCKQSVPKVGRRTSDSIAEKSGDTAPDSTNRPSDRQNKLNELNRRKN